MTEAAAKARNEALQIHLFGAFRAERAGKPLSGLHRRGGKRLLAYLVLHAGQEISYRTLAEHFFSAEARSVAQYGGDFTSTRQAIRYLRMALGQDAERLASVSKGVVCLDLTGAEVDAFAFDRLARSMEPDDWETALALYQGPLLEDWSESWAVAARVRRQREYERLLRLSEMRTVSSLPEATRHRPSHNLPVMTNAFIGRQEQIAEVKSHLANVRLLTLTGSGGCGKTRLALKVAEELTEQYPDGVRLAELASLTDATLVPQTLALALGIPEKAEESLPQTLTEYLRGRRVLLVVDNCEHLVSACATLLAVILRSCPDVRVLATSRERLNIAGELTYRVPSLSLPGPNQALVPANVKEYEAVRLFVERARLHKPDFAPDQGNTHTLARICHRLDGIPLAIELAAARVRALSPDEIDHRLNHRFRLLTGGDATVLPRQQTLRALMDWSYQLLTDPERTLLARLSVFAGDWTLESAEQVCSGEGIELGEVLDLLTSLYDKSLVEMRNEPRYRMLETVRQYGVERLGERGETETLRRRHRDWYLAWAEKMAPGFYGDDQTTLERFAQEHDNLRAALACSLTTAGEEESALRLAAAVSRFRFLRGFFVEGREDLERAIARTDSRTTAMAAALLGLGRLSDTMGEKFRAQSYLERSYALFTEAGDAFGQAHALLALSTVLFHRGDYVGMQPLARESLSLFRSLGDRWGIGASLGNLAICARSLGRYDEARTLFAECRSVFRDLGNQQGFAQALENSADLAFALEEFTEARSLLEECLGVFHVVGNARATTYRQADLAMVLLAQGDTVAARALCEESFSRSQEIGIPFPVFFLAIIARHAGDDASACRYLIVALKDADRDSHAGVFPPLLRETGYYLVEQGHCEDAISLWGAQEALSAQWGVPISPKDRREYDRHLVSVRSHMEEETFSAAWERGRALSPEQAIHLALELLSLRPATDRSDIPTGADRRGRRGAGQEGCPAAANGKA